MIPKIEYRKMENLMILASLKINRSNPKEIMEFK
jgi:hypothetical protein